MIKIEPELLQRLINKYGEEEQLLQVSGECGELVAVIQNYLRAKKFGHRTETMADVIEEAVDVYFMVQQVRHIDAGLFDDICKSKMSAIHYKFENEG